MNRRRFLALAGGTVLAPTALAEPLAPTRTFFLPPRGGWISPTIGPSAELKRMIDEFMAAMAKASGMPERYLRGIA